MVLLRAGERVPGLQERESRDKEGSGTVERERLLGRFESLWADVETSCGPLGVKLLEQATSRSVAMDTFKEEFRELPNFAEFQAEAQNYLEKIGVVERQDGFLIVDIEKLKRLHVSFMPKGRGFHNQLPDGAPANARSIQRSGVKTMAQYTPYIGKTLSEFLYNAFYNAKVVSKEDYVTEQQLGAVAAKDLFYNPQRAEDAFDVEKIKDAKFYVGLWEVAGQVPEQYSPSLDASFDEVSFAALVYHPQYGNGERDAAGRLVVTYKNGERKPITWRWLYEVGYTKHTKSLSEAGNFLSAPSSALAENKVPLLAKLLNAEDFKTMATTEQAKLTGLRRELTQEAGYVMLNDKIRYALGRGYGMDKKTGKNIRADGGPRYAVYQVNNEQACIVEVDDNKNERVVATFALFAPDDSRLKRVQAGKTEYWQAAHKDITIIPFSEATGGLVLQRPGESADEYAARAEAFDFNAFLQAKQAIYKATGVSLQRLTPLEQAQCAAVYNAASESRREQLHAFITRYREDGLKAFLAFQMEPQAWEMISAIDKRFGTAGAAAIFKAFETLSAKAQQVDKELEQFFAEPNNHLREVDKPRVSGELLRSAVRMFDAYSNAALPPDYQTIVQNLSQANLDLQGFASIFKSTFKGKEKIEMGEVRGLHLGSKKVAELSAAEKNEMLAMAERNWQSRGEAGKRIIAGLKQVLKETTDSDFYMLRKDNKLLGFVRFDKPTAAGHRYAGSFNVDPNYRGNALGEAMMLNTLKTEAEHYVLEASVHPDLDVGMRYVEDIGFTITRVLKNYEGSGDSFFEIICDTKRNEYLPARHESVEKILAQVQSDAKKTVGKLLEQPSAALAFDPRTDRKDMLATVALFTERGYIVDRYFAHPTDQTKRIYVFDQLPVANR